jgi:hypothetical protein
MEEKGNQQVKMKRIGNLPVSPIFPETLAQD